MITQNDLILYAFRYALGRKTYVAFDMADHIIEKWQELDPRVQRQMQHDIREAVAMGRAGMEMDERKWKKILGLKVTTAICK